MALSTQRASKADTSTLAWKYDVFLSFRGETRKGFTDHLFEALRGRDIKVFMDRELERGTSISTKLLTAIEESRFAIIVLSQNYASSTWCLDELSKVFECMEVREAIFPVYYHVKPSDIRKKTGSFAKAFKEHETNFKEDITKVQRWRTALMKVSDIAGWISKEWFEAELVKEIVESMSNKVARTACHTRIESIVNNCPYLSCIHNVWHQQCLRCKASKIPFTDDECVDCPCHKYCYKLQCDVCKNFIRQNSDGHIDFSNHCFRRQRYCPSHEGNETAEFRGYEKSKPRHTRCCLLDDGRNLCMECQESKIMDTYGGWKNSVVQRDIRAASCNTKSVDFGLAQPRYQERGCLTTGLVGTFGYLTPEYVNMGRANKESDAYECGVVSSEIARAANNFSNKRKLGETVAAVVSETENLKSMNDDSSERGAGPRRFSYPELSKATNNFSIESKLGETVAAVVSETENLKSMNDDSSERGAGPRRFSYPELSKATNNFSIESKLGEGRFGAVYLGYLADMDIVVAVKIISRGSRKGREEYIAEVKASCLRHRNLLQIIGWSHDGGQFILVYEFMPNGSLDSHFFGMRPVLLPWSLRYKISLGLASALLYLHEGWKQCVVHRDIKSSNIMLDSSFNVKLGDFGLARFMDHELGPQTFPLVGTLGYCDPEYVMTGRVGKELDVYGFGVVALEIATGKKSGPDGIGKFSEMGLVEWVWDFYRQEKLLSAVDERLHLMFDEKQVERLMIVGLWCAHADQNERPTIRQAIQYLNFDAKLPNLPAKMPSRVCHESTPASSVSPYESLSTTSLQEGR